MWGGLGQIFNPDTSVYKCYASGRDSEKAGNSWQKIVVVMDKIT